MNANNNTPFKYYVGIHSLEEIACKDDRIVVMNILGNESRKVTPVSHVFSNGNIVAGVQYGRPGVMKTPIGDIPVYSRLAEVMEKHEFDTGVIYLPPSAVYYAVAEMCHYNKSLKKIVLVTEKLSVKDQRLIRAIAQINKVDVFGANSLGVADAWNKVRIGGGLGGDRPDELLIKGSIALHSNSGNFSTTITEYLKTQGFGTSTVVSSGKDKIIQFAVAEFLYAAENDPRTKAVVLYVEPGGYYEKQALDWIKEGKIKFTKPIIALVTGRWKSKLTRAVGHAGALAGSNDDAIAKEKWFDRYFRKKGFDPNNPSNVSKKGIRVSSIQHIPLAMKAVFEKNGWAADFENMGDLGLKPWFANDMGLKLPQKLKIPVVEALAPYNQEIAIINKELGASYLRQSMRNASGASAMNTKTQLGELHGKAVTALSKNSYEENIYFSLAKELPNKKDLPIFNIILNYLAAASPKEMNLVKEAEKNGATPNQAIMTPISLLGNHPSFQLSHDYIQAFIRIYSDTSLRKINQTVNWKKYESIINKHFPKGNKSTQKALPFLKKKFDARKGKSNIKNLTLYLLKNKDIKDVDNLLISSLLFELFFSKLVLKRMTRDTLKNSYAYLSVIAKVVTLGTVSPAKNNFIKKINNKHKHPEILNTSFTETAFWALFNEQPTKEKLLEFSTLLGVTLTNGPGTISAKGAKESVSARNNITTSFVGYLANTGLAHGGNGFEGIQFIIDSFDGTKLKDPSKKDKKTNISQIADQAAKKYIAYKKQMKSSGASYGRIPGINHPVFKGKKVNIDPREDFIYAAFKQKGITNLFWDFYKEFVKALYKNKGSKNTYCVNIDGVIAAISFKLLWNLYTSKKVNQHEMQKIGFNLFLFGRTVGIAAEIDDHRNRGLDMDTRTPASEIVFVV